MFKNDLALSLKSDTFSALKEDFDSILAKTIGNMEMKGAEDATITLKLGVSLEKSSISGPNGIQNITKPSFKHDISSVMQVKDKKSGALTGDFELVWDQDEGKYVMRRIDNGQTTLYQDEPGFVEADYKDLEDEQKSLPAALEGSQPDEKDTFPIEQNSGSKDDTEENGDTPSQEPATQFDWLLKFVGEELGVEKNFDDLDLVTSRDAGEDQVVLSSSEAEHSVGFCSPENLEPHLGHQLACVGYKDDGGIVSHISIECETCGETVLELDKPATNPKGMYLLDEEPEDSYFYDEPEEEENEDA